MLIKCRIWWQGNQHSLCSCVDSLSPSVITRVLLGERQEGQSWRWWYVMFSSVQLLSCIWLCNPMDCSTPGFPVHHQLPELTQTHIHRVGDAIQPSHPLPSPSPLTFYLSQHQGLWPKYWSFSFSISPSKEYSGLLTLGWTGWISLLSKGLSRVLSNTTVQKHQFLKKKKKKHQFLSTQLSL